MRVILQRLRNVSSNYLAVAVHGVIIILLTPFVVRELGTALYAAWVIVQTIGYYLGFLDFGIADAQVQRHSVLSARKQGSALRALHGTVFLLFLGAGVAAVALAAVVSVLPSADLFDIPADAQQTYTWALRLFGFVILFSFIETAADGIFEGQQRYDLRNAIDIVVAISAALATFAVLSLGYGLVGLAVVAVADAALGASVKWFAVRRAFPATSWPKLGFDRDTWRAIRGFSLWNCLNDLVTEGTAQLDKLLIPVLLASALLTPYSLIVMAAALVFIVAEPITETIFPLAASRHGKGDTVSLGVVLARGSKLVNTVTLPTTIILLCFGPAILDLWVGSEYTNADPRVLWFTVLNFYLSTYFWSALAVLMGCGLVRRVFWTSVLEIAIVLALILALVPPLGLAGLALAGLLGNALIGFSCFVAGACALIGLKLGNFLCKTLLRPLIGGAPAFILGIWLARNLDLGGWIATGACVVVTGLIALIGVSWLTTTRWERARYTATARRVLRPLLAGGE